MIPDQFHEDTAGSHNEQVVLEASFEAIISSAIDASKYRSEIEVQRTARDFWVKYCLA